MSEQTAKALNSKEKEPPARTTRKGEVQEEAKPAKGISAGTFCLNKFVSFCESKGAMGTALAYAFLEMQQQVHFFSDDTQARR